MKPLLAPLLLAAALPLGPPPPSTDEPTSPQASATRRATQIAFEVTPASVIIFLDGQRLGKASEVGTVRAKPGRRVVRLERGEDQTEMEVVLTKGKTLRFNYEFGE